MKLNSYTLAAVIFVLLFGGISFTGAMNWWQTESAKVPVTYSEGEAAGQYNPADIRGSYTFGEVSELFQVPLADLQAAFRLPAGADPAAYPLKSLEAQFAGLPVEMGTGAVRLFVAFYKGLPYDLSAAEDTYLFPEAAEVLRASGQMRPEQAQYLETHTVVGAAPGPVDEQQPAQETASTPAPPGADQLESVPTEHTPPERKVTGKTTFQDLLDWGLTQAAIEQVLGEAMPNPQTAIKDYSTAKGQPFSELKDRLQAELEP